LHLSYPDIICTVTSLTAETIACAVAEFSPYTLDRLIVGGGGSKNLTLLNFLKQKLLPSEVLINEDLGLNSDSKEAVAFAVLANETLHGNPNTALGATGARHQVVMGKISL